MVKREKANLSKCNTTWRGLGDGDLDMEVTRQDDDRDAAYVTDVYGYLNRIFDRFQHCTSDANLSIMPCTQGLQGLHGLQGSRQ